MIRYQSEPLFRGTAGQLNCDGMPRHPEADLYRVTKDETSGSVLAYRCLEFEGIPVGLIGMDLPATELQAAAERIGLKLLSKALSPFIPFVIADFRAS